MLNSKQFLCGNMILMCEKPSTLKYDPKWPSSVNSLRNLEGEMNGHFLNLELLNLHSCFVYFKRGEVGL